MGAWRPRQTRRSLVPSVHYSHEAPVSTDASMNAEHLPSPPPPSPLFPPHLQLPYSPAPTSNPPCYPHPPSHIIIPHLFHRPSSCPYHHTLLVGQGRAFESRPMYSTRAARAQDIGTVQSRAERQVPKLDPTITLKKSEGRGLSGPSSTLQCYRPPNSRKGRTRLESP